ncbi:MAG: hypothetical protein LBD60_02110 [Puniceicoccales bacterium]|nr:hypothetical protein [Puniceicoccales bacterium]
MRCSDRKAVKDGKISRDAAEGYHMALDYDANQFSAKMVVAQFGGQLLGTTMEEVGDKARRMLTVFPLW